MVRPGIGLYGLWPSPKIKEKLGSSIKLIPVLSWKTVISEIKYVSKGKGVSYDLTEKLKRDSRLGICPIGYWHGYSRRLSGKSHVLVKGQNARVLGRVCMDMIIIDLTAVGRVKVGEEVTLVGGIGRKSITADRLAGIVGTNNYEIVTRINPLIKRIYF
jgi:alanine racemase